MYYKKRCVFTIFGTVLCVTTPVLIHRGLHGKYGIGKHGLIIFFLGLLPLVIALLIVRHCLLRRHQRLLRCACLILATLLSACLVVYYLSNNGLWCAQHPTVTREMCSKLREFASFAVASNVTLWWLTFGDLLAVQRGLDKPIPWEHDIDVCITAEQFQIFDKALKSGSHFHPKPEYQAAGHVYLPIDMEKLGITHRDAEGVNVDIWTCPPLPGNITRLFYCNGWMNFPGSMDDRHAILRTNYGDYSVVKYAHHESMCKIWHGW